MQLVITQANFLLSARDIIRQVSAGADRPDDKHAHRLYTNVDCHRDKLVTDDRHYYHTHRPPVLTAPETIDVQLRNFLKYSVWAKILEGSLPLFLEITEFPSNAA